MWKVKGGWWRVECGCWTGVSKGHCPNKLRLAGPEGWGRQTEAQTAGGILSSSTPHPRPPPPGIGTEGRGRGLRALARITLGTDF